MTAKNFIRYLCLKLGCNNKAIYPVVAVATANAIFRPTFTMLKKGENPESKKYAAMREFITEVIAVPTYYTCGVMASKFGEKVVSKAMNKKIAAMEAAGEVISTELKKEMKTTAIKRGKAGLMLIGVCTAAGLVIPALCSLLVTPIMSKIGKKPQETKKLDIKEAPIIPPKQLLIQHPPISQPAFKNVIISGMKVGAL